MASAWIGQSGPLPTSNADRLCCDEVKGSPEKIVSDRQDSVLVETEGVMAKQFRAMKFKKCERLKVKLDSKLQ
jgi:hypothetical protein